MTKEKRNSASEIADMQLDVVLGLSAGFPRHSFDRWSGSLPVLTGCRMLSVGPLTPWTQGDPGPLPPNLAGAVEYYERLRDMAALAMEIVNADVR